MHACTQGEDVDHVEAATVMTVVHAYYCQDKPKFGWSGKKKQCCEQRKCFECKTTR